MTDHGVRHWKLRGVALAAVAALAVGACSGAEATPSPTQAATPGASADASAPPAADGLAEICAAGAEEGKLVHWHNHSEEYIKVIELFNETYPDIEVELLELSPDEATQRILTEVAANRDPSADLLALGLDVAVPLLDRGELVTDRDWAALGVPEDVIHETGQLRKQRTSVGLGFNTDKLSEDEIPSTWEELIDAKWAGRVIVDPRGRPFDALSLAWGEEKTLDYVQRLKDVVKPLVIEGGTAGLVSVAGGEADISTSGRSAEMLEQQAAGAPLAMKYLDVVATIDNYNMVLKKAANLNAATCFAAWFSIDGQELYNEVEFKSNEAIPPGAPDGADIVTIETPEQADAVKAIGKKIGEIWTSG
jgi:iron(III) transport system substrate-binding protein